MNSAVVEAIEKGQVIGSLSGSALLGLVVLVLGYIVWHLYKLQQNVIMANQDKQLKGISEIKKGIDDANLIAKEQTGALKENSKNMMKFIELHCEQANTKLTKIDANLSELDKRIGVLTHTRSSRVNEMLRKKEEEQ